MGKYAKESQEVEELLRLRTLPVGIKLFERVEDIPDDFEMIEEECGVCQVIGLARHLEKAKASDQPTACGVGCYSIGLCDPPPKLPERPGFMWGEPGAGMKMVLDRMHIERGKFKAIGVAPLETISVEPDIIQIWGRPYQMMSLAYANAWDGSDKLELATNGHGASCCEALVVPYLTGKPRLAIADQGDRWQAFAQEDEMILGTTLPDLRRLIVNLRESYKNVYYPRKYNALKLTFPDVTSAKLWDAKCRAIR